MLGEEKAPENKIMKVSGKTGHRVYAMIIDQKETGGRCGCFPSPTRSSHNYLRILGLVEKKGESVRT